MVEKGACTGAKSISFKDCHSKDTTLENILAFKENEDLDKKLILVTAEDVSYTNDFQPGQKFQRSQVYVKSDKGYNVSDVETKKALKRKIRSFK